MVRHATRPLLPAETRASHCGGTNSWFVGACVRPESGRVRGRSAVGSERRAHPGRTRAARMGSAPHSLPWRLRRPWLRTWSPREDWHDRSPSPRLGPAPSAPPTAPCIGGSLEWGARGSRPTRAMRPRSGRGRSRPAWRPYTPARARPSRTSLSGSSRRHGCRRPPSRGACFWICASWCEGSPGAGVEALSPALADVSYGSAGHFVVVFRDDMYRHELEFARQPSRDS
jgi:hypothetical protein